MADNVSITAGTGTTVASDDVGGVQYQRIKLGLGADGTANDAIAGAGVVGVGVQRITLASDDPGVVKLEQIRKSVAGNYESVAAGSTAQVLGGAGAAGDFISHLLVIPTTVSPGPISILDNATSMTVFAGGTSSLSNAVPFTIPLNMYSVNGAWKLTTGSGVSVIAVGSFT
jgi:hypothetical protein